MVKPAYAVETWLGGLLHATHEAPVLGIIFGAFLIAAPAALVSWSAAVLTGDRARATRYSYALAPLGFGIWLAHYGFHFLTGLYTFIPVSQRALGGFLGEPHWRWTGIPARVVQPIEPILDRISYSSTVWTPQRAFSHPTILRLPGSLRIGPEAFRFPPGRSARICNQRNGRFDHRAQLGRRKGDTGALPNDFDPPEQLQGP